MAKAKQEFGYQLESSDFGELALELYGRFAAMFSGKTGGAWWDFSGGQFFVIFLVFILNILNWMNWFWMGILIVLALFAFPILRAPFTVILGPWWHRTRYPARVVHTNLEPAVKFLQPRRVTYGYTLTGLIEYKVLPLVMEAWKTLALYVKARQRK